MGILHKGTFGPGGNVGNPSAALETVIYVTPPVSIGPGDGNVGISGTVNITPGTAATGVTLRIRQGPNGGVGATGPTGTPVSQAPLHTVAAGAAQSISFGGTDTSPFLEAAGGAQYAITAQQTAATGNGTTNMIDVEVIV